jgi:serine/threonine-protein kinase
MPRYSRSEWLAGRYEKLDRLDSGGMADVCLAADHGKKPWSADRQVALKILKRGFAEDPNQIRRFEREGKAMIDFEHRNIVTAYEQGSDGPVHFLVMEYID